MRNMIFGGIFATLLSIASGQIATSRSDADDTSQKVAASPTVRTGILLLRNGEDGNRLEEVDASDDFFNGQRFRLRVSAARAGYLYVMCLSSIGESRLLFPSASDLREGNRQLRSNVTRTLPSGAWYRFDEDPGTEKLYVIVSKKRIPDLEKSATAGGELSMATLRRYASLSHSPDLDSEDATGKGIVQEPDPDVTVKLIQLSHMEK